MSSGQAAAGWRCETFRALREIVDGGCLLRGTRREEAWKRIFGPLGMKDTTFKPTKEQRPRVAVTYGMKDGKLTPAANTILDTPEVVRHPVPAGGLPEDGVSISHYDPADDAWTTSGLDSDVPYARAYHSAIWTGSEMIVFGGQSSSVAGMTFGSATSSQGTCTAASPHPDEPWLASQTGAWGLGSGTMLVTRPSGS